MRLGSLLSPLVAFPLLWCLGVGVAQIHLLEVQTDWSTLAWAVMVAVPIAFVCGGLAVQESVSRWIPERRRRQPVRTSKRLRTALAVCVLLGYLEFAHQAISGQGVALLSSQVDATRVSAPGGPSILLLDLASLAAIVALCVPRRLTAPEHRFELVIAALALALPVLGANRSVLAMVAVTTLVARSLFWGLPSSRALGVGVATLLIFFAGLFVYRNSQQTGDLFYGELFGDVLPGTPAIARPLVPVHIGLATNFEALARLVDFMPDGAPYGHGLYNAKGIDLFVPEAKSTGDISKNLSGVWVTSTVAGSLWADGGFPIVVLGVALTGTVSTAAYVYARRRRTLAAATIAGLLFYHAIFGVYTNLWTSHLDWILIGLLLMPMAALAHDPGWPSGARSRLELRLRGIRRGYAARVATSTSGKSSSAKPAKSASAKRAGRPGAKRRGRRTWGARLRRSLRSEPARWALGGLGALLVAAAVIEITRPDDVVDPLHTVEVGERLPFPTGTAPAETAALRIDGDFEVDNTPLWLLDRAGTQVTVRGYAFGADGGIKPSNTATVRILTGEPAAVDVATWQNAPAMFSIAQGPSGARVRGFSLLAVPPADGTASPEELQLDPRPPLAVDAIAPIPPPDPGVHRDFALATWTGTEPDLFVIDRGVPNDRPLLRILSGESRFRRELDSIRLPLLGLDPAEWSVDLAVMQEDRPDLVMTLREGGSRHPEVHTLSGESDFQSYVIQRPTELPAGLPAGVLYAYGSSRGTPTIFSIDALAPEPVLDVLPLFDRPGPA